jgi:hypothetical protein
MSCQILKSVEIRKSNPFENSPLILTKTPRWPILLLCHLAPPLVTPSPHKHAIIEPPPHHLFAHCVPTYGFAATSSSSLLVSLDKP